MCVWLDADAMCVDYVELNVELAGSRLRPNDASVLYLQYYAYLIRYTFSVVSLLRCMV